MNYSDVKELILKRLDLNHIDDASGLVDSVFKGVLNDIMMSEEFNEVDFRGLIDVYDTDIPDTLEISFSTIPNFLRLIGITGRATFTLPFDVRYKMIDFSEIQSMIGVNAGSITAYCVQFPDSLGFYPVSEDLIGALSGSSILIKYVQELPTLANDTNLLSYVSFNVLRKAIVRSAEEIRTLLGVM